MRLGSGRIARPERPQPARPTASCHIVREFGGRWRDSCWLQGHGGAGAMKAALTVWDGRISPVFDVSREALVLTIEAGAVVARRRESIVAPTAALKLDRLAELGIDSLICGAISEPLHHELTIRGVRVTGFVAGEIEEVLASFLAGRLPTPELSMPGCCRGQNRFRGGRAAYCHVAVDTGDGNRQRGTGSRQRASGSGGRRGHRRRGRRWRSSTRGCSP